MRCRPGRRAFADITAPISAISAPMNGRNSVESNASGTRQVRTAKTGATITLWRRTGSRHQLRSSLRNAARPPRGACGGPDDRAGQPRRAQRARPRQHEQHHQRGEAEQRKRRAALDARVPAQLDGSRFSAVLKPSEKPDSSTASSATNTIQPDDAATSITPVINALMAPPERERESAPNAACGQPREDHDERELERHAGDREQHRHGPEPGAEHDQRGERDERDQGADPDERRAQQREREPAARERLEREVLRPEHRRAAVGRCERPTERPRANVTASRSRRVAGSASSVASAIVAIAAAAPSAAPVWT